MEKEKGVSGGYKLNRRSWWLGYRKMSVSKRKKKSPSSKHLTKLIRNTGKLSLTMIVLAHEFDSQKPSGSVQRDRAHKCRLSEILQTLICRTGAEEDKQ